VDVVRIFLMVTLYKDALTSAWLLYRISLFGAIR